MRAGTGIRRWPFREISGKATGEPSRFSSEIGNEDRREAATTGFLCACVDEISAERPEAPVESRVRLTGGGLRSLRVFKG